MFTESAEKLQTELRELRVQHYTLKEQHDDLKEKMKFFTKVISRPLFTTIMHRIIEHRKPYRQRVISVFSF